jgi:hypothetical protein
MDNISPTKKTFLSWNGEINPGNILTALAIIVAIGALFYQKKLVETKIDDLEKVILELKKEKGTRELHDLKNEEEILKSSSYNLEYTINQMKATDKISNSEFIFILNELNDLIELSFKNKGLTAVERKKMEILKQRNKYKEEVFTHSLLYNEYLSKFQKNYEPKESAYKNSDEYIEANKKYIDTLSKHIILLQTTLDNLLSEPSKKLNQYQTEYFELKNTN